MGQMGPGWIFRRVVLHHEPRLLVAQCLLSRHQVSDAKADRCVGRAPELRLQAETMDLARRKLLGRWSHDCRRYRKFTHQTSELSYRCDRVDPFEDPPVVEIQLQQRNLYPLWWRLSEPFGCLAVQLAGKTELSVSR